MDNVLSSVSSTSRSRTRPQQRPVASLISLLNEICRIVYEVQIPHDDTLVQKLAFLKWRIYRENDRLADSSPISSLSVLYIINAKQYMFEEKLSSSVRSTAFVVAIVSWWAAGCRALWRHVRWRHWQGGEKERQHLSTSGTRWRTESCLRLTVKLATHRICTCRISSSSAAAAAQIHHSRRR